MSFKTVYTSIQPFSFEIFPPKTPEGLSALRQTLAQLAVLNPALLTVTFGAMGTNQQLTQDLVLDFYQRHKIATASHLTCVHASAQSIHDYVSRLVGHGIQHIVALRGDAPADAPLPFSAEFAHAEDLVRFIKKKFPGVSIAVAGYPEKHLEASNIDTDLIHLKAKVDAGADAVVTQMFYSNDDFYHFRDRCVALGITVPIIPGLMPVMSFKQILRITSKCGASLPSVLRHSLEAHQSDPARLFRIGTEWTSAQARDLIQHQVPGIHLYVLNRAEAAEAIVKAVKE